MQPFEVVRGQLLAGPDGSSGGEGIEVVEFEQSGGGFVVIAANENVSQTKGVVDDLVGTGAIADDVAEIGYEIVGRSCRQAGFHGFEVGVNVAKQQDSQ